MGKVVLARVDERLIHGQVMMTLSQRKGVDTIFVVDDTVAADKFMVDLYRSAGGRTGKKTIVMTTERAKYYWDNYEFRDYNTILIARNVDVIHDLVTHGVPMPEINLGGMSKKPESEKMYVGAVNVTESDIKKLKELRDDYGSKDIYFQSTPAAEKEDLDVAIKDFGLN